MPQRSGGVTISDGLQTGLGRTFGEGDVVRREACGLREQRAIVDLLMEGADFPPRRMPQTFQVLGAGNAGQGHCPGERAQVVRARGQKMGSPQAPELHPVLEHTQGSVVAVELFRVGARNVRAVAQTAKALDGLPHPQGTVGPAVDELEELNRELHVAKPALAQFELAIRVPGGDVVFHPAAHRPRILDEVLVAGRLPDHRPQRGHVLFAEFDVAGNRPSLEQRLEFPAFGPPLVVGDVRFQGSNERPVLAFGPQIGVKDPQPRLRCGRRDNPGRQAGELRGDLQCVLHRLFGAFCAIAASALAGAVWKSCACAVWQSDVRRGPRHVDDVDVGYVIDLARPGLPHGDDRQIDVLGPGRLGAGDRERGLQRSGDDGGDRSRHLRHGLQSVGAGQIAPRNREDSTVVPAAQSVDRLGSRLVGDGASASVRSDGGECAALFRFLGEVP